MIKTQTTNLPGKANVFLLASIFILLSSNFLAAQIPVVIDSLKRQLITATDTSRADLCLNISEKFVQSSLMDSAEVYATKGLEYADQIGYKKGKAIAYDVLSMIMFETRDMEKTMELNRKAVEVWRTTSSKKGLSVSLHNLGRNYYYLNNYEKALEHYFQSIRLDEELGDHRGLASGYMNVGVVQNRMGRDTLALDYFLKSIDAATRGDDFYSLLVASVNISGHYEKLGDYDNAQIHAEKAYGISEKNHVPLGIVKAASSLSNIFIHKKDYKEAIRYADIILNSEARNFESRSRAYRVKAEAYEAAGNLKEAILSAELGLTEAKGGGEIPSILGNQDQLFHLNKKAGNFEKALAYKESYHILSDSLYNIEKNEQINSLMEEFQAERKQKQIDDLQHEAKLATLKLRQKNGLLLFLVFFTLAVLAAIYYFNKQKLSEEKRKTLLMQQKLLRTQLNPHFIFNALSAIQNFFFEKEDGPKAAFYLSKFAKLMRLILENSREDYIQLDQEIATLEYYLNLQKIRFNDTFEYSIECDPDINKEITAVPPMLAQPFIENCLEHGLLHKEESGKVKIRFEKIQDILEFTIEDNGIGREKAGQLDFKTKPDHESMATRITEDRLSILNRKLKRKAKLIIADVLDTNRQIAGTKVTIQIPLTMV